MPSRSFAERILEFVQASDYEPRKLGELAEAMHVGEHELGDFHDACKALMKTGRVVLGSRDAVLLAPEPGKVIGLFRLNPRGFGFVIPETPTAHGDLYVPAGRAGDALTGDTVIARAVKRGKRRGEMLYEGRIERVLRRGQSRFVGELTRQFGRWLVVPEGNILHAPIAVGDPGAKSASPGDQVVVEILEWPTAEKQARGVIVKVLGPQGEPDVDLASIVEQYQFPVEFPEEVLENARSAVADYRPDDLLAHREDLRNRTIITIDPDDARDFDDAICIETLDDGTIELGVHIADVAHFVREGSPLDIEAQDRGNSVYLPRMVIPMLPEVLSNGVCSLQERQPRLTKSVFIRYDRDGVVQGSRMANSVISSTKRLTYEQATKILEGKPGRTSAKVVAVLREMETLARAIRQRRIREGMLVLSLPEVELIYDKEGHVVDVEPADTSFSHTLIEMFMVEANEAVARQLTAKGAAFLRRVHGDPGPTAMESLQELLKVIGHDLKAPDRFGVQKLLDEVRGEPESFAVNLAVLKSMQQAEYSPAAVGHYALASGDYCHFTSPIRRYPDLTVHRLVDQLLRGELTPRVEDESLHGGDRARAHADLDEGDAADGARRKAKRGERRKARRGASVDRGAASLRVEPPIELELKRLGAECSFTERHAEAAERELKLVYVLRLLEDRIGDELQGVVTGIATIGVFVQLTHYLVDGLLRFSDLTDDWWNIDSSRGLVVGERTGVQIRVGDRLDVIVSRVHVPTRQLVLGLTEPLSQRKAGTSDAERRKGRREGGEPRKGDGRKRTGVRARVSSGPATGRGRGKRGGPGGKRGRKRR